MANAKLSAQTAMTNPTDDDLVFVVEDPGGTPLDRKCTYGNFSPRGYGSIYVTGASASQTLSAATWTKITQFAANSGISLNTTEDHSTDIITLSRIGHYQVAFQVTFNGTASQTYDFAVYLTDPTSPVTQTRQDQIRCAGTVDASDNRTTVSAMGLVDATTASLNIELWAYVASGADVDVKEAQLTAIRV